MYHIIAPVALASVVVIPALTRRKQVRPPSHQGAMAICCTLTRGGICCRARRYTLSASRHQFTTIGGQHTFTLDGCAITKDSISCHRLPPWRICCDERSQGPKNLDVTSILLCKALPPQKGFTCPWEPSAGDRIFVPEAGMPHTRAPIGCRWVIRVSSCWQCDDARTRHAKSGDHVM
jgi:hypothetical protein